MIQFSIPEPPVDDRMEQRRYEAQNAPVAYCDECGEGIHSWEKYYDIDGVIICTECISNFLKGGV